MPQVVTIKLMNHGELPLSSWSWRSILQKYVRLTRPFRAHYRPLLPKESIHKWCPLNLTTYQWFTKCNFKVHTTYLCIPIHYTRDCFLIAMLILWSPQFPILLPRASRNFPNVKTRNETFFYNWTSEIIPFICLSK